MPNTPPNFLAGGTIRPSRFVKISDDYTVQEAGANDRIIGICGVDSNQAPLDDLVTTNNHATTGQQVKLFGEGDVCLLRLGGTVSQNDRLKSDGTGSGVIIATTGTTIQHWGAVALQDGVSGEDIEVLVQIGSERPALT